MIWSWYTGCRWVGCYIWCSEEGTGRSHSPCRPLLAVPKYVTGHPSTASVPITVLLYDGPLLCCFNMTVKGLEYLAWSLNLPISDSLSSSSSLAFFLNGRFELQIQMCDDVDIFDGQVKPLGVVWGKFPQWSRTNTVMVDDLRRNFIMNPQNGLKVVHQSRYSCTVS